jgi:C-terminal processing protease CtpA/Prc
VIVLVDGDSASSSEFFAAMMQDRHAALILGAPTFGAGCGHMTDAEPVVLRHSGARVSLPDCVRLRADGSNEVAGIQPDVLIGFKRFDTPAERVARLARALPQAVARTAAGR